MDISKIAEKVAELLLPKLGQMEESIHRLDGRLEEISNRLTDLNNHQIALEQRIDGVREELTTKIENVRKELTERIDKARDELTRRDDEMNRRLDRLFEVVVKREEHVEVLSRVGKLEEDVELLKMELLKRKIAV